MRDEDTAPTPWTTLLARRRFIAASLPAVGGLAAAARALGATTTEEVATTSGEFPVIDTHTHFYDPTRPAGVPWPPREDTLLYRPVLTKHYLALPVPRPVTGTIVVEASPWVEDNQWVLELATQDPFIVGLVGNLPVGTKEFAGHLRRFATNPLFRGIRLRDRKLETALNDPALVRDLRLLADQDLALDLVGGGEILSFADGLAKLLPGLRIVIDHLAGVVMDGQPPPAEWTRAMRALAESPSVYFKVSGLVEGTGRKEGSAPRDVEFYRPVLDTMRGLFGVERLIYGSNWPVSERFAPLGTVQGIVASYFRDHGRTAEESVFWRSAKAAYRWLRRERPAGEPRG